MIAGSQIDGYANTLFISSVANVRVEAATLARLPSNLLFCLSFFRSEKFLYHIVKRDRLVLCFRPCVSFHHTFKTVSGKIDCTQRLPSDLQLPLFGENEGVGKFQGMAAGQEMFFDMVEVKRKLVSVGRNDGFGDLPGEGLSE